MTFYLDGGPSCGGLASTIVDCTGEEPIILREGALGADEIREVVEAFRSQRVTTDRQTDALGAARRAPPPTPLRRTPSDERHLLRL